MMIFDDANIREVARLVVHFNPRGYSAESVAAMMRGLAQSELKNTCSYCGTMGFMLTSYVPDFDRDNIHIKASLDTCLFHGLDVSKFKVPQA